MVTILFSAFSVLVTIFVGVYACYFTYLKKSTKRSWNIEADKDFKPRISILIPARNEEATIESKLRNVESVEYPLEKIEVVVVDDASEDKTRMKVDNFVEKGSRLTVKVCSQSSHRGKAVALNSALPVTSNEIVIVSDSDTEWPTDLLRKTLPYMADMNVGAVTCGGLNRNQKDSWVTKGEETYLNFAHMQRLGESKIHSTIRFEGGFCAFRKSAFREFDAETGADDSGTALEVIQRGHRAIFVPETVFYTSFSSGLKDKFNTKTRRATQLMGLWSKSAKLLLNRKLLLPKRIAIPNILLFFFMPLLFLSIVVMTAFLLVQQPIISVFSISLLVLVIGLMVFARRIFVEVALDNLILSYALMRFLFGHRYVAWKRS